MATSDERARFEARVGNLLGGKWKLDRLIGIGGMAAVYAASHRNGAQAAIKILHAQYARRADARTRFLREAYIANKAGKGAVAVIDDDVDDHGAPYLVMDLLIGEPVEARAKRRGGKLHQQEVLWIAAQVLKTLEHAHQHGIVHRDLKPDNLFWTTQQVVKVLDFGVARLRDANTTDTTRTGTVLGTPTFMAPEQAVGATSDIDARADLWSLGAIMFRLLTGRPVHLGSQTNALVTAATKRAPAIATIDPTVPDEVAAIVDTALQFEREKRFESASAMLDAVELVLGDDAPARTSRTSVTRLPAVGAVPAAPGSAPALASESNDAAGASAADGLATGMSHDDSVALHLLLRQIGEAVLARAERGANHPETNRRVETAFRHATESLANAHIGLFWNVVPEGFVAREQFVWMAKGAMPRSPERMYDDGVRMLGILPGIVKQEFEELVRMVAGDLAPFSDYATFLHAGELVHVVHRIDPTKPGMVEHASISLDPSSGGGVESMLGALVEGEDGAVRVTLLSRLERWGEGHEAEIGAVLESASLDLALGLLRVLQALATDAARVAIAQASLNPHPFVRLVALSYLGEGPRLFAELRGTLEGHDARARCDVLVGIERYKIVPAGPALARHLRAPAFDTLPVEERRQALSALGALLPLNAESIAIELLTEMDRPTDASTREIAAELLGSIGESREAEEALASARAGDCSAAGRLRGAAALALQAFEARAKLGSTGEGVVALPLTGAPAPRRDPRREDD